MKKLTDQQKTQLMSAETEALKNPYPKDAATVYGAALLMPYPWPK